MRVEKTSEKNFGFGFLNFFLVSFVFGPLPCRNRRERIYANYMAKRVILFCIV